MYKLQLSRQAVKELFFAERAGLKDKIAQIMGIIEHTPFEPTLGHSFEKLKGNLKDMYSRRINYRHRFVYSVFPNTENMRDENGGLYEGIVLVDSMWGHNYK